MNGNVTASSVTASCYRRATRTSYSESALSYEPSSRSIAHDRCCRECPCTFNSSVLEWAFLAFQIFLYLSVVAEGCIVGRRAANWALLIVLSLACTSCEDFWHVPIASISVTPPAPSLLTGFKQQFTASATYVDGTRSVLKSPVWTSSNAGVLFINDSGTATAVAPGSATVSASEDGVSGSTSVTITSSPLTSIEISPSNPSITAAQGSQQFAATGFFSDGTVTDITSGVSWSSSDLSVATISKTGLASAVGKAGNTTIQATSGNVSTSTTLTVTR